jgi:hypothetical protein
MRKLYQVQIIGGLFDAADIKEVNKQLKKAEYSEVLVAAATSQAVLLSVETEDALETTNEE